MYGSRLPVAGLKERQAHFVVRQGGIRLQLDGFVQRRNRFGELSLLRISHAEIILRRINLRVAGYYALQQRQGNLEPIVFDVQVCVVELIRDLDMRFGVDVAPTLCS